MIRSALIMSLGLPALILAGCGEKAARLVPVSGTVTVQGTPLPYGTITLIPNAAEGNTSKLQPRGTIGPDGKYTLETDGQPGAPVGSYIVTISSVKPSTPEDGYKPPVWAASQDYMDAGKSGLGLTVMEAAQAGAYDIDLKKK
jgi:hypothetical protein